MIFREGTQMIMMIMIRTYLNHHDHLRSPFCLPFNLKSAIAPLKSYIVHRTSNIERLQMEPFELSRLQRDLLQPS
jgi:hypothetical protein